MFNSFYRGYYYDEEIELYYLQSRYYDACVGRFINADQQLGYTISEKNLYCYCRNICTISFDNDGRRTYFLNGIKNISQEGVPDYAKTFSSELTKKG